MDQKKAGTEKANVTLGNRIPLQPLVDLKKAAESEAKEPPKRFVECFLCRDVVELRYSKRDKPYFICDPCGLQAFIRKDRGISRLGAIIKPRKFENTRILDLLDSLAAVNSKITSIRDQKPIFGNDPELDISEKALLATKRTIQREIKEIPEKDKSGNKTGF